MHFLIIRITAFMPTGDLFRRPVLMHLLCDDSTLWVFQLACKVLVSEHFPTQQYPLLMHGIDLHQRASLFPG